MKSKNISESGIIKRGIGKLKGLIINSHSSGTVKIFDSVDAGVNASGVLTSAGACAPAEFADQDLTSTGVNVTDGDTCTIGTTVYRFKNTLAAAYDVKIGASAAITLDNLKAAINATGTAGTEYFAGTLAHPTVIATTNTDTVQTIRAKTIGTAANSIATTETAATLSWGAGTMANGVATTNAKIVIGTRTYIATKTLHESLGYEAVADYVLWVTSEAVFLDNLKKAINASGTAGTEYSTGTLENFDVVATTNTNTQQTIVNKNVGTAGNAIATTETMANYSWGAATLENGAGETGKVICNTITFSAVATTGERYIPFYDTVFDNGLYITIGGTADLTILYK